LKTKKIYIDIETSIESWLETNHNEIINTLYDNIFDFVEGSDLRRTVLKVVAKPKIGDNNRYVFNGLVYDFMFIRDNINDTIEALIKNFEELEDYEKCSKLVKLRNDE
jgi:hypothetical protein